MSRLNALDEHGESRQGAWDVSEQRVIGIWCDHEMCLASELSLPILAPFKHHELISTGRDDLFRNILESIVER